MFFSSSSNRAISSASRRRAQRAASSPLSNRNASAAPTFASGRGPERNARASRLRSANRSFVEPSRLQLSWCVLRSTKTGDVFQTSSVTETSSSSPYHRALTRVAPCSRVSRASYTSPRFESRYTEVTAPPSRFEKTSSLFSSAGNTSTGRCFASSSFSASTCLGSTQYLTVLRSNASGGRHVSLDAGSDPAPGSDRARAAAYAALAASTTGSNEARRLRKLREVA